MIHFNLVQLWPILLGTGKEWNIWWEDLSNFVTPLWHNYNLLCGNRPFVQPSWSTLGINTCGDIKKLEYHEKGLFFCHSFHNVKPIYYIDSLHRVKYFMPLFLEILMIMAYRKWNPQILSHRKFEYYIKSIKKDILNRNVRLLKSIFIYMHSILAKTSSIEHTYVQKTF